MAEVTYCKRGTGAQTQERDRSGRLPNAEIQGDGSALIGWNAS